MDLNTYSGYLLWQSSSAKAEIWPAFAVTFWPSAADSSTKSDEWHHGSGGLLVVSFLTSVAIGMALELGRLLLNHVCCKCCPCHDDEAISDAPAGQRADVVVAQPAAQA